MALQEAIEKCDAAVAAKAIIAQELVDLKTTKYEIMRMNLQIRSERLTDDEIQTWKDMSHRRELLVEFEELCSDVAKWNQKIVDLT